MSRHIFVSAYIRFSEILKILILTRHILEGSRSITLLITIQGFSIEILSGRVEILQLQTLRAVNELREVTR